jgi:hypothetical protein
MIDLKNWKNGPKIGFVCGLICTLYSLPVLIARYSPTPYFPIRRATIHVFPGINSSAPLSFFR